MSNHLPLVQKAQLTFHTPTRKAQLKQPVDSLVEASYSAVLSLANYILYHNPTLCPPNYSGTGTFQLNFQHDDISYPQEFLTYNKLFEPWCDYLSELLMGKKVAQQEDVCFLWDFISDEYLELLNSEVFEVSVKDAVQLNGRNTETNIRKQSLVSVGLQQPSTSVKKTKKIGLINFALSQNRTDFIKPKMHLIGLFTGIFYNQGDEWKTYNVLRSEFPSVQEYKQLDTVILSGSSLSVNDQTPQVVNFVQTLREAIIYNPKLKILGICYGHQTLAKMFGGKIVEKKLLTGVQTIAFDQQLILDTPYFRRTQLTENTFELSQYHKDFVVEIPESFDIFAQSETCKIQSLISKNKKYLSFQFHPEYSAEYIKGYEMRLQHYQVYDMKSCYSKTERGSITHTESLWKIRKIIRSFLDWEMEIEA